MSHRMLERIVGEVEVGDRSSEVFTIRPQTSRARLCASSRCESGSLSIATRNLTSTAVHAG